MTLVARTFAHESRTRLEQGLTRTVLLFAAARVISARMAHERGGYHKPSIYVLNFGRPAVELESQVFELLA
jgi:hypothetical protein